MALPAFSALQPYKPRSFVPQQLDLGDWSQVEPLFDALEQRVAGCATPAALEGWLLDWSELTSVLDEEGAKRYIAMTCDTEDREAEKAYLEFIENVEPRIKPRQFQAARAYMGHPVRGQLPKSRYEVFDRDTGTLVELFRPENVPLETGEAKLGQHYQKLTGGLTVQFQGREQTLVQMARYQEEPDRNVRREAWELVARRRLAEKEEFEEIFEKLLSLRQQIARNAGFPDYRAYIFRRLNRFDYTPADCERFHDAVEAEVVPLLRHLHAQRRQKLGLDRLRPWDTAVDPLNRPPLRPFGTVDEMISRTAGVFHKLDPELARDFELMRDRGLLDLENRKGKAPGGYQSTLAESRLPFIFMNAVGLQRDVETILHEAGHAFHALATQSEDLHPYRNPPIEICEVASMSMELLGNEFIEEFYAPAEANRARKAHLEGVVAVLPWIAQVDAFQHWIYTHPGHSRAERAEAWTRLVQRFGGEVDWSGYAEECAHLWHRQLHIFLHPFYYIEYGIAQLGALQIWANSHRDKAGALQQYKQALALGGARPLPELFRAAGCRFDFGREAVSPVIGLARKELEKLAAA